ncbi:MAG: hypothetical protein ACREIW_15820 [Chthoniobacterales bacterium]
MKGLSLLAAVGLAFAFSVGAQTTTDEKQESTQPQEKTNIEENAKAEHSNATTHRVPKQNEQTNVKERSRTDEHTGATVNERAGANVNERGRTISRETTVFRNGREMHENLALRRSFRDRADVHFSIGTHPRDWWLRTYSIVLMEGCHYYLADNGCWYPAYGFDPSCDYPAGAVYCE